MKLSSLRFQIGGFNDDVEIRRCRKNGKLSSTVSKILSDRALLPRYQGHFYLGNSSQTKEKT